MHRHLFFGDKPFLLDGATGTYLMQRGLLMGECPEAWACDHPEIVKQMHRGYVEAGAKAVYAFTFGANPVKLKEYGLEDRTEQINQKLVAIARDAVGKGVLVGGDLSPVGQLIYPMGVMTFSETKKAYARQAKALAEAGVDFLIIETMLDIGQTRAAILGCREVCNLPIAVSMTFEQGGRTLTGTDATTAAITLCALGVNAIGVNCSTGPDDMKSIVEDMRKVATVPILAKPNAGLPNGHVLNPEEFAQKTALLIDCGAVAVGGCCGTTPEHIAALRKEIENKKIHIEMQKSLPRVITGREKSIFMGHDQPLCAIGERLNPTGKPKLQQAIRELDLEAVWEIANEQIKEGAQVLDVNVGVPGVEQSAVLPGVVEILAARGDAPLCIDTVDASALEAALEVYCGRALVNSISAENGRAEKLMPLCKKYGAMAILLPIGDTGVPQSASERIALVEELLAKAKQYGLEKDSFVVDALAMTIASQPDGGKEALKVLDWCKQRDILTVMGVSNISFGMPQRPALNAAFLCAAQARGLTSAIVNVCQGEMKQALLAANALLIGGSEVSAYAQSFAQSPKSTGLTGAVINGERSQAYELAIKELSASVPPLELIDRVMEGLVTLGDLFAAKKTFLPQLMAGAEAAKAAFAPIQKALKADEKPQAGTAVIATVKGDMHDIGKNIVALMLQNHGFRVIDLGKDVENEKIIQTAQQENADVVCLSALLTTTMEQMRAFSQINQQSGKPIPLMVGGAVVTEAYAREIGATYSADAVQCARKAMEIVSQRKN